MGPKKAQRMNPIDPKVEKQYREEEIARALYQREEQTQLPKVKKKIVDIDDENALFASMINNQMLVPIIPQDIVCFWNDSKIGRSFKKATTLHGRTD